MSNLINRVGNSSQAQFTATALVSGAVVAGAIFSYQALRRQEKVEDLKSSIPSLGRDHHADLVCSRSATWQPSEMVPKCLY